jgi:hypothetical protein
MGEFMKYLSILLMILSFNVYATGGFDCISNDKKVEIYGTTGRFWGNPLIGELGLIVDGVESKIAKDQIIGYWNMDTELKLIAVDSEFADQMLLLKVEQKLISHKFKGTAQLKDRTVKVECTIE